MRSVPGPEATVRPTSHPPAAHAAAHMRQSMRACFLSHHSGGIIKFASRIECGVMPMLAGVLGDVSRPCASTFPRHRMTTCTRAPGAASDEGMDRPRGEYAGFGQRARGGEASAGCVSGARRRTKWRWVNNVRTVTRRRRREWSASDVVRKARGGFLATEREFRLPPHFQRCRRL